MDNDNKNFDRIESFLLGHMTAAESSAFEQEMAQDTDLANEVAMQRLEHRTMELLHQESLRANMQQWKEEADDAPSIQDATTSAKGLSVSFTRKMFFRLAAAASITLVLGFFARQFMVDGPSHEAMAMEAFGYTETNTRGSNVDPLGLVYEAMSQKDYRKALDNLEIVPAGYQAETVLNLKGECHFYLKEYKQAGAFYERILQSNTADGDLLEKAEWRLALCYMAQGGRDLEVERLLDKMVIEKGQFEGKAREMRGKVQ